MSFASSVRRRHWLAAIGGAVTLAPLPFCFGYARFASDVQHATQRVAHSSRIPGQCFARRAEDRRFRAAKALDPLRRQAFARRRGSWISRSAAV